MGSTVDWKQYILSSDVSDLSKKMYISQIDKLIEDMEQPVEWIIAHPSQVYQRIRANGSSVSCMRNRVSAVCSLLKHWPSAGDEFKEERDTWCEYQKKLNSKNLERAMTGQPSEREVVNWVPWKRVLKTEEYLRTSEFGSLRHLVLAMYTHMEPMRGDFGNVRIYTTAPPACDAKDVGNYIFLSPHTGKSTICLNEYKTAKRYGQFNRALPESLVAVIRASLQNDPREYLFLSVSGEPYTKKNSYIKFANRMLYSIFGKHMSITLLRHAFISAIDFNASSAGDLMNVSKNMQHSIGMQQYYRRSVPETTVALRPASPVSPVESEEPMVIKKKKKKRRRHTTSTEPSSRIIFI
jgi:hypothetical protein